MLPRVLRRTVIIRAALRGADTIVVNDVWLGRSYGPSVHLALARSGLTRRRGGQHETREHAVRRAEARRLALAISGIDRELADNKCHLADLVTHLAPQLLAKRGVGAVSAAQAIVSWSHPGRCRNDAAYAALAGASPIPASSGRIVRHRLNRGGDRHLNRTLHDILLTRWRTCQRTRAYITRRRAEGKTDPEIRRCLKRYIARELYRCLNTAIAT